MRQVLHYPLPAVSTLQQWAANVNIRNGLLSDIINVMGTFGKSKSDLQKLAIISFDEMKVSSLLEYDVKFDEVIGSHSYVQV